MGERYKVSLELGCEQRNQTYSEEREACSKAPACNYITRSLTVSGEVLVGWFHDLLFVESSTCYCLQN